MNCLELKCAKCGSKDIEALKIYELSLEKENKLKGIHFTCNTCRKEKERLEKQKAEEKERLARLEAEEDSKKFIEQKGKESEFTVCKYAPRCKQKGRHCEECKHNPNAKLQDYFHDRGYIPVCYHEYDDCIHDPAKDLYEYDKGDNSWIRERYTREEFALEVKRGCYCESGMHYDNEDK